MSAFLLDLDSVVKQIQHLPSLPAVVVELLSSMQEDDIDTHALAAKITLDQSLTAKTLRLANSSFYGMSAKVTSIGQAISVLGFHSIRTLVTACSVTASFAPGPGMRFDFPGFWRHSVGTAVCARLLAPRLGQNPETAFTAGLLHDLGTLVLATRFPADYQAVEDWRRRHDCAAGAAELAVFGFDHAMVGSALAARWKFPQKIQQAVAAHHDGADASPSLALTVYLANVLAHALDLAGQEDDQVPPLAAPAWAALALDEAAASTLFAEAEQQFHDMCQILVN